MLIQSWGNGDEAYRAAGVEFPGTGHSSDTRVESHIESAALAAAKARGKRLGTPDPIGAVERMRAARKAQAAQFAAKVLPIIRDIGAFPPPGLVVFADSQPGRVRLLVGPRAAREV
jgi:hypothetical protein